MGQSGSHLARAAGVLACALALLLALGCNAVFDIGKGAPRPLCADPLLIDDLEDGDERICPTSGREGSWFGVGDGTIGAELNQRSDAAFEPTLIEDGPRGNSRYAARLRGSGFTLWGAVLGVGLESTSGGYDALGLGGIRFWMKSTTPIAVSLSTTETTPIRDGGECTDSGDEQNCYNDFTFSITAPSHDWDEYWVPFNALRQRAGGSVVWNPRHVTNVLFNVAAGAEFDVSVDDLSFYYCSNSECQPTCTDPEFPVSCREGEGFHSSCQPPGSDCSVVNRGPLDPALVEMGGGDPACVGLPSEQLPRCFLEAPTGIPFAARVNPYTDGISNARLRNPEPGKVCMKGTLAAGGTAAISPIISPIEFDFPPLVSEPFDLQARDIDAIEFTITHPPEGGVSLELRSLTQDDCAPGFYCLGPVFSLGGPNARVFEDKTVRAKISEFEPADPGPRHVLSFYFWGHDLPPYDTNYDFCLSEVKFFNSLGELVTPPPAGGG